MAPPVAATAARAGTATRRPAPARPAVRRPPSGVKAPRATPGRPPPSRTSSRRRPRRSSAISARPSRRRPAPAAIAAVTAGPAGTPGAAAAAEVPLPNWRHESTESADLRRQFAGDRHALMIRTTTLDCGITVVSESMPDVRSVSAGFWVGVGSRDEPPAQAGASHFLEHLLFKGTDERSARDIAEAVDAVGGEINAFTT